MIRTNPPSELVYAERIAQVIELLQGKWTVQYFDALQRSRAARRIEACSPRCLEEVLTASLRSLEAAHVVLRRDLSGPLLHVEYQLTESMRESSGPARFSPAWAESQEDLLEPE